MGNLLRPLVPYLDFDPFVGPPSLKNPSTEYRYLRDLVAKLRREIDVAEDAPVEFEKLIGFFHRYQAVIIPTLWGRKAKHENALHLHLPDSRTTWIYLNLDVELHDFKFWMVHELAHVLTVDLIREDRIEEAENFADAFAGAFLFPEAVAEKAVGEYRRRRTDAGRLELLCDWAERHTISPNTVYRQVQNYAHAHGEAFAEIEEKTLHAAFTRFNQRFPSLAEALFDGEEPSADQFMRVAQEEFGTGFFKALARYVREKRPSPGGIASILSVNPMDARAYFDALLDIGSRGSETVPAQSEA
ncbi:MAG: ImmA/IrrE family metallo-endopeptidase [Opitutales bacterium]|nr:ImmA/IrrE family metallo-endopeptidase [Opitutales bacterium]